MTKQNLLKLIKKISPDAKNYVLQAFKQDQVEILYTTEEKREQGVFLKAENEEQCILFASFCSNKQPINALNVIEQKLNTLSSNFGKKEFCFNVYGKNTEIIDLVKKAGFELDMYGYIMEYKNDAPQIVKSGNLVVKSFKKSMLQEFAKLFDDAYFNLCKENNWEINSYTKHKQNFLKIWSNLAKNNQIQSFWLKNNLIGAYIFKDNHITDIVVAPQFQGRGYGTFIAVHCLNNMIVNHKIKKIRLRVSKNNINAIKLYQKIGFKKISFFAEHTYK